MVTFEILDAAGGQYYWRIVASNGQVLAHSETYVRKTACEQAIRLVKSYAANARMVDKTAARRAAVAFNQVLHRR